MIKSFLLSKAGKKGSKEPSDNEGGESIIDLYEDSKSVMGDNPSKPMSLTSSPKRGLLFEPPPLDDDAVDEMSARVSQTVFDVRSDFHDPNKTAASYKDDPEAPLLAKSSKKKKKPKR